PDRQEPAEVLGPGDAGIPAGRRPAGAARVPRPRPGRRAGARPARRTDRVGARHRRPAQAGRPWPAAVRPALTSRSAHPSRPYRCPGHASPVASKEPQMSTYSQAVPMPPVPPSLFVRIAMRPMPRAPKPLIRKLAGRRHFRMAAEIRHVGRKSGRAYVTPAGARVSGDVAVIPLTFGNESDWSKNVRAAGGCSIRAGGQDFAPTEPQFVDPPRAPPPLAAPFCPARPAPVP